VKLRVLLQICSLDELLPDPIDGVGADHDLVVGDDGDAGVRSMEMGVLLALTNVVPAISTPMLPVSK
jgi:hypothetical protein